MHRRREEKRGAGQFWCVRLQQIEQMSLVVNQQHMSCVIEDKSAQMEAVVTARSTLALRRLSRLQRRLNDSCDLLCAVVNNCGHVVGCDK